MSHVSDVNYLKAVFVPTMENHILVKLIANITRQQKSRLVYPKILEVELLGFLIIEYHALLSRHVFIKFAEVDIAGSFSALFDTTEDDFVIAFVPVGAL